MVNCLTALGRCLVLRPELSVLTVQLLTPSKGLDVLRDRSFHCCHCHQRKGNLRGLEHLLWWLQLHLMVALLKL